MLATKIIIIFMANLAIIRSYTHPQLPNPATGGQRLTLRNLIYEA